MHFWWCPPVGQFAYPSQPPSKVSSFPAGGWLSPACLTIFLFIQNFAITVSNFFPTSSLRKLQKLFSINFSIIWCHFCLVCKMHKWKEKNWGHIFFKSFFSVLSKYKNALPLIWWYYGTPFGWQIYLYYYVLSLIICKNLSKIFHDVTLFYCKHSRIF